MNFYFVFILVIVLIFVGVFVIEKFIVFCFIKYNDLINDKDI